MPEESKTYSLEEVEIIKGIAEMKAAYTLLNDSFNEHRRDDEAHFERLYNTLKEARSEIGSIPHEIMKQSEALKTDVLNIGRREFTSKVDFRVFKTYITASIAGGMTVGTVVASFLSHLWGA